MDCGYSYCYTLRYMAGVVIVDTLQEHPVHGLWLFLLLYPQIYGGCGYSRHFTGAPGAWTVAILTAIPSDIWRVWL